MDVCQKKLVTLQKNKNTMMEVNAYRQQILDLLLQAKDDKGEPRFTEKVAIELSKVLTDQELIDGMDFNTPEEVAELLLDAGLDK